MARAKKLTEKQDLILNFIEKFSIENPFPPTLKEIAEEFKITLGTVQDHVFAIEKKGFIKRYPDVARGFKVTRPGDNKTQDMADMIPIYGNVAAGEPIFATENIQGYVTMEKNKAGHKIHFALRIKGESMKDAGIFDGDIVIVRKQEDADNGDVVIALMDDEATCKTLKKTKIKAYLEAANPRYKAIMNRPFDIIGKVIELRRGFTAA